MVKFKENYHFTRFRRGVQHFPGGGVQFFPGGGSNCSFLIETHITCDFPCSPPSGSTLACVDSDEPMQLPVKLRKSK